MILGILGLVFIIIATFYTYRTAKENGHNAIFWTLMAFGVGFGVQLIVPFLIGVVLGVILIASGHSVPEVQTMIQTLASIIGVVFLFASVVGIILILRKVSTIREDSSLPPPPQFYQNG
jgi:cytochrome bd-type quinol oxidase subunit 2